MALPDAPFIVTFHDVATEEELSIPLDPNQCIGEIYKLFDENDVKEPNTYYLAYNEQVLHKAWTLLDANIPNGARIDICTRQLIQIIFKGSSVTFNEISEFSANISTDAFIGDIKDTLSPLINKKPHELHIYWNNQELNNASTLIDHKIFTDTTMTVTYANTITVQVEFLSQSTNLQLFPTSTIQDVFDLCIASLEDVSIKSINARFGGKQRAPNQTLQEIGVGHMDKLLVDIEILGGRT